MSSSHPVSEKAVELSEFEYGLVVVINSFGMGMVKAMLVVLAFRQYVPDNISRPFG